MMKRTSAKLKTPSPVTVFVPEKIVTGGQTGVDRAGLDVAIALGLGHGGWCPRGRLAEDGSVPSCYEMIEHVSPDYKVRTRQNVIDSNATLILYEQKLRGGTLLTQRCASELQVPCLCRKIDAASVDEVRTWLGEHRPNVLNVAGPRESSHPGIYERSFEFLHLIFSLDR